MAWLGLSSFESKIHGVRPVCFLGFLETNWHDAGRLVGTRRATSVSIVMLPFLDEVICMWLLLTCRFSWSLTKRIFYPTCFPYSLSFSRLNDIQSVVTVRFSSILWYADSDENGQARRDPLNTEAKTRIPTYTFSYHSAGGSSKGRVAAPTRAHDFPWYGMNHGFQASESFCSARARVCQLASFSTVLYLVITDERWDNGDIYLHVLARFMFVAPSCS